MKKYFSIIIFPQKQYESFISSGFKSPVVNKFFDNIKKTVIDIENFWNIIPINIKDKSVLFYLDSSNREYNMNKIIKKISKNF